MNGYNKRNKLLAPLRRTLARRKYEKAFADYQKRLARYEVEYPRWLAKKEEWEATQPKVMVSVGGVKPSKMDKVTDLASHFPGWGGRSRNDKWRFFVNGKTKKGSHHVWCERPAQFREPEPVKPCEPTNSFEE